MTFGILLRAHRHARNLSQEELAARSQVSVRNLRDLESGRIRQPRQQTVRLLADALALTEDDRREFYRRSRMAEPAARPARTVPAQLPPDTASFTGRAEPLAVMDRLLATEVPARGTTIAVVGPAGVGKTTLAAHWAHRVRDAFPDGQLYVNLHGFDPRQAALDPTSAAHALLHALGVPVPSMPLDEVGRTGLLRSLLTGRRMLVLLDNARDAAQVRPLLAATVGCAILVTSRDRLVGLVAQTSAHLVRLDPLTTAEARLLLRRRVGADRYDEEPTAARVIADRCSGLPLALAVTAARVVTRPAVPLRAVADEMTRAQRLDAFVSADEPTDLRSCLSGSYRLLSPPGQRLFRLLGLHPGMAGEAALVALAGGGRDRTLTALAELARAHLVEEAADRRWFLHDLVAAFAVERLAHE
ncbi:ATP-binding protein, partial [Micromonospora sp. NBS 11-29]|uniref:ATP-binding protein n=1 Tax=Micromonospora sp. NBS 11-29 TaxID=1960879 RepID=UPI001C391C6C